MSHEVCHYCGAKSVSTNGMQPYAYECGSEVVETGYKNTKFIQSQECNSRISAIYEKELERLKEYINDDQKLMADAKYINEKMKKYSENWVADLANALRELE